MNDDEREPLSGDRHHTDPLPVPADRPTPDGAPDDAVAAMSKDGEGYDCALMDLEMPVMDGYTATRQVREAEDAGELRVSNIVALSASLQKEGRR